MPEQGLTFMIEGADIIFPNFAGKVDKFNLQGLRSFHVKLTEELADQLAADEWNVKLLKPREEGDEPSPHIQVFVRYDIRPPRIVMITSTGRTTLSEDTVSVLDYSDFETVDIFVRGHVWDVNGKQGVKAYLQTMFATLNENELDRKYAVPGEDHV